MCAISSCLVLAVGASGFQGTILVPTRSGPIGFVCASDTASQAKQKA